MLILGQNFCSLGPVIFEIPQPNWRYAKPNLGNAMIDKYLW